MRLVNASGRSGLVVDGKVIDVARASGDRFDSDPQNVYSRWSEFRDWAATADFSGDTTPLEEHDLGAPVPRPRQVFAIGLNYRDHAEEAGMEIPTDGMVVFTKFPSSITGPFASISVPKGSVDFETELVVVIGEPAYQVSRADAWAHVAGLTAGQDLSERELQLRPPTPQFNLGKSYPGFAPIGPAVVSIDEFADPDNLAISCTLNGAQLQNSRTSNMIYPVPVIIEKLSAVLPLYAGDIIFTGTPAGIGWARDPKVLLKAGDELSTTIETIGTMRNTFVDGPPTI